MAQIGRVKAVALEEHFATPCFMEGPGRWIRERGSGPRDSRSAKLIELLLDIGEERIKAMDESGVDMQVLSLNSPGVEQLEAADAVRVASEANERLAEATRLYPRRFAGFAAIPTPLPAEAADMLERAVHEYGFRGAAINGHVGGRYLDDRFFWPILERAEDLRVPIYIHPTQPPKKVVEASYMGNFSDQVSYTLSTSGWGWHIETALYVLRMILGGAFDAYPRLQVIIGHLGEALPFMLQRIDRNLPREATGLDHSMANYLRENVYYTFSGFNFTPAFLDLLLEVGADRIMFSVDYPYGSMTAARSFLDGLPISTTDKVKISSGNAERLLGLKI
jgi:predicted TIM-barrel fold metal-dependent hydrolase